MEIIGYFAAILIGLSLGLVGGGGSILTVPILIYFFNIETSLATTYSLFVVGITSAVGSVTHFRQKNIHLKIAFIFGLPSVIAVFLMRIFVMPAIPNHIYSFGNWELTKSVLLMLVFSILMILAAISMIKTKRQTNISTAENCACRPLIIQGLLVGIITGFVGVGGGFLIIPSLVLLAKMPMKKAIGTSLLIMTFSSLLGVTGDLLDHVNINYLFLSWFSFLAIAGIITGSYLTKYIDESKLKPAFGYFVLTIGVVILITEFL
jgi:hypothetical protein